MRKWNWIVHPEDTYLSSRMFATYVEAKEYADGLCCSYTLEKL